MNFFEMLILSLIEGLTEFLPVSSTGHLIITSALFGINEEGFVKSFNIIIQAGAISSVLVIYWRSFLPNLEFYKKLIVAFLPAAVIGLLIKNKIDQILGSVTVVAFALIVGGFILIWVDKKFGNKWDDGKKVKSLSLRQCAVLGFIQCFAFVPGVSRSAATIVGGMFLGLSKKEAAEFSFFLAVPTLTGAALIKSLKIIPTIEASQITTLLVGTALAFVFAYAAIKIFLGLIKKYGLKHFGYYRIVLGIVLLIFIAQGYL